MPLFAGDVIEVLSVVDEFWLLGNKDGVTGQFPSTFVEAVSIPSTKAGDRLYVCINDFTSTQPGTLSLKRGDVVAPDSGAATMDLDTAAWQRGRSAWGARGLLPSSCLKELQLSSGSRQLSERCAQAQATDLPPHALGRARALMSLHAQLHEELDFRQGDLIIITGLPEPGWFQGELEGRAGVFPEGFVELLGPLRSPLTAEFGDFGRSPEEFDRRSNGRDEDEEEDDEAVSAGDVVERHQEEEEVEESTEDAKEEGEEEEEVEEQVEEAGGVYGVALYDFRAMEPGELDFDVGDRVRIVGTLEDGWLEGEVKGQRGVFPHRFVKMEDAGGRAMVEASVHDVEQQQQEVVDEVSGRLAPGEPEHGSDWMTYEDHTVWDLDYFERAEERRTQGDASGASTRANAQVSPQRQPPRPAAPPAQQGGKRPRSAPPSRPRLPPRPSLPSLGNRRHASMGSTTTTDVTVVNGKGSSCVKANKASPLQQLKRIHSLTLPSNSRRRSKESEPYRRSPEDTAITTSNGKAAVLGKALVSMVASQRQKKLTRHASVNDVDMMDRRTPSPRPQGRGLLPGGARALEALVSSAGDLESKLSQQLFEFERSLSAARPDTADVSPGDDDDNDDADEGSDLPGDRGHVSRHYSILDYGSEGDIIRGSAHAPAAVSLLSSVLGEGGRTLRPPPPRPRILRPPAPAVYRPARPPPRRPPPAPCRRQRSPQPPAPGNPLYRFLDPEQEQEQEQ
ncbi:hypothetical protein CRUP_033390, partial [Coryphaenoides rupestris]